MSEGTDDAARSGKSSGVTAEAPEHHLLRTLAAVPPGTRLLDLSAGATDGARLRDAVRLGFDAYALCEAETVEIVRAVLGEEWGEAELTHRIRSLGERDDVPDAAFEWVIQADLSAPVTTLRAQLRAARRHLEPGGWVWVLCSADAWGGKPRGPGALTVLAEGVGLAVAEAPQCIEAPDGTCALRGLFRRVERGVIG